MLVLYNVGTWSSVYILQAYYRRRPLSSTLQAHPIALVLGSPLVRRARLNPSNFPLIGISQFAAHNDLDVAAWPSPLARYIGPTRPTLHRRCFTILHSFFARTPFGC